MFIRGTTPWLREVPMSGSGDSAGAAGGSGDGGGASVGGAAAGGASAGGAAAGGSTAGGAASGADPGKTVLGDPGKDGTGATAGSAWREDWRDAMATINGKVDDKFKGQLARYATPEAFATAHLALRTRMDSGDFIAKLPADAKPEEVTAWRTQNGIPDKPEGYLENLPAGLVIGEKDKGLVGEFLSGVHAANASPAVAHAALQSYYKIQETRAAEVAAEDATFGQTTEDTLRAEWGGEYRANVNAAAALVQSLAPAGTLEKLLNARMDGGSGRPLASDPDVMRFLNVVAREINPAASVMPGAGAAAGASAQTRLAEITAMMGKSNSEYWRGPKADALQKEFRDLTEFAERTKSRAA